MYEQIFKAITNYSRKFVYKLKIGKKFKTLFSYILYGGVASGDPCMTTFGNTIRVICMYRFILYKAGITDYRMSVGGDDFFIILL